MPDTSAPAVPPTPPVTLSALLAREGLALRQIAGPSDPDLVIHWVHTSEMADPYPYLLGGELLLSAGVHVPRTVAPGGGPAGTDEAEGWEEYFDDYVSRIVAAGGAALGFGLAPVHDTVPRALVAACEAHALPLLEVPPQTTFSGVARAVWQLMAQSRLAELRRITEAQQSLAAAASRTDPVPSVLRRLAQRVSGWTVLYGPDGTELATAGRLPVAAAAGGPTATAAAPGGTVDRHSAAGAGATTEGGTSGGIKGAGAADPVRPALAGLARVVTSRLSTTATDTTAGVHLAAYALGTGQGFVLGVATPRRDPADHTVASVAAVLLSLLTGEHQSGTGAARCSALVRLLLGGTPETVAPLLGAERGRVVHALPDGQTAGPVAASALGAALGSALVDLSDGVVRVLVPDDREPPGQPGWTLGVSAPAAARDWPVADVQAARALARARATRVPLVRHGDRPGLAELVPHDEAIAHARALLAPVAGTPALTETLRAWLSLHGSWDRTAVALTVHRNTVRQRIARCAALLDADLDDPDVRMELWFALKQR